jgi:hypothetical protein
MTFWRDTNDSCREIDRPKERDDRDKSAGKGKNWALLRKNVCFLTRICFRIKPFSQISAPMIPESRGAFPRGLISSEPAGELTGQNGIDDRHPE